MAQDLESVTHAPGRVVACTIVARNYLPQARVLCESFRCVHPRGELYVLLIDDWEHLQSADDEAFTLLHVDGIGLDDDTLHAMAAIYDVYEFATAVKPALLTHLLERCAGPVLYLDPDIEVFAALDGLADLAARHSIVLTPHVLDPMPRDGYSFNEQAILCAGIYNLGFVAVSEAAGPFLRFWTERLRQDAIVAPDKGYFTDQRWVDFVPGLFPHHILRDPTVNVAYWNVYQRPLRVVDNRYFVGDAPLKFFHFSGFEPASPYLLSKHQGGRPRVLLSESPVLAKLCREYVEKLARHGNRGDLLPYGLSRLPNGVPLHPFVRRYYRRAWIAAEQGGAPVPTRVFSKRGADALVSWLRAPVNGTSAAPISRFLQAAYEERPDLQAAFPDLGGPDAGRFCSWARHDPGFARLTHDRLKLDDAPAVVAPPVSLAGARSFRTGRPLLPGVNIAGYFHASNGVGQAARSLLSGIEQLGAPVSTLSEEPGNYPGQIDFRDFGPRDFPFDINLICVNADQTPVFAHRVGSEFFRHRHNIGLWFWELEKMPASMIAAAEHLDEVWVASEFSRAVLSRACSRPVFKVPLPVAAPRFTTHLRREDLALPDGFLFLFYFDFHSVIGRKNPSALIEAFLRAFDPRDRASLVIKSINGRGRLHELERLRVMAASHPNIRIIDRMLPESQVRAMTALCDCYVSLHRSEGFGLPMAEAMAVGKPVIATAYSGNLDFMTEANSFLVPYQRVRVGEGNAPYSPASIWAEPDVDAAASLMRRVFDHRALAQEKGLRAREDICQRHGLAQTAAFLRDRFEAIRRARTRAARVPPPRIDDQLSGAQRSSP